MSDDEISAPAQDLAAQLRELDAAIEAAGVTDESLAELLDEE